MSLEPIRISHPKLVKPVQWNTKGNIQHSNQEIQSFRYESETSSFASLILELSPTNNHFNRIEIHPLPQENEFFPDIFRIEMSQDGKYWEPIIQEAGFRQAQKTLAAWNFSLTSAKFVKFIGKVTRRTDANRFKVAFGAFRVLISGITKISVSSEADRLRVKENLIDERPDYGWASKEKSEPGDEFLVFDLAAIHRIEEIRMLSKKDEITNFPEKFTIFYSEDDLSYHQLMEEPSFLAEPGTWYRWRFLPVNARFVKIICNQEKQANRTVYISEIIEVEFFASADKGEGEKGGKSSDPLPYASVLRSGMVRLAVDGETRDGVAVQGSDRRLREATTEYKGIVELATDGEVREGVVVQGNDKRLKDATEQSSGLVKLARSGDTRTGVVVQGNDERLKLASTDSPGIVELAEDGETRPGVAVQGNDRRLRKANRKEYGLVILAELGESAPDKVITGDDPRLRDASTEFKGIVRLAQNGEDSALSVVQGNDKRLRDASTEAKGIVQLARSGESKPLTAVQGNDRRLQIATEDEAGIVLLAKHGSEIPGKVVQSDDPRLKDSRNPLPHTHEYAPKDHSFSDHTGLIRLTGNTSSNAQGIFPPPINQSVIYGKNENPEGAGLAGQGGKDGVVGFGNKAGLVGISSGDKESAGVIGLAKSGLGGAFASQFGYALEASGKGYPERSVPGSGKAIHAIGNSLHEGEFRIQVSGKNDCIARVFRLDTRDVINPGDLLVSTEEVGKLAKSKNPYATNALGVLVTGANLLFGKEKADQNEGLVAISGIVQMNVDPSMGAIVPGDLLTTGLTSGYAIKLDPNKAKVGCVIGKALEPASKEKTQISVLLCFS
jgi:hypothetical protein